MRTLPVSLPKDGSNADFSVFLGIKLNFNRIKSATKFRYVKTSIGRAVEQSISYEITKNTGRKVFLSTWNIGLNWATPLLLARRTLSALPNDVMSKIQSGQLHSELFGRRHSSLQSHGLFALAKHLLMFGHCGFDITCEWSGNGTDSTDNGMSLRIGSAGAERWADVAESDWPCRRSVQEGAWIRQRTALVAHSRSHNLNVNVNLKFLAWLK